MSLYPPPPPSDCLLPLKGDSSTSSGSLSLSLSSDEADLLPGELFLRLYTLLVSMPGSSTPGSEIGLSVLDEPLLFLSALIASEA